MWICVASCGVLGRSVRFCVTCGVLGVFCVLFERVCFPAISCLS